VKEIVQQESRRHRRGIQSGERQAWAGGLASVEPLQGGDAQFVTLAMLETVIERQIEAMGEAAAREFIETMFRHVAALRAGGCHA
jgi:ABC-type Fe3+ transport system substrate-binding protein